MGRDQLVDPGRQWLSARGARHSQPTRGLAAAAVAGLFMVGFSGVVVAQSPSDGPPAPTVDVIAPFGVDGSYLLGDWEAEQGVSIDVTAVDSFAWEMVRGSLASEAFDVVTVYDENLRALIADGLLAPIEICQLQNWDDIFPVLRETDFIRGEDGQVYAVPVAWYDTPFVYAPDRVSRAPDSILDLLDPVWRGRLVLSDADAIAVMHQLAVARGLPSPSLGPKQLAKVSKDLGALMRNVGMVVPGWSEATAALSQGAADLAVVGGEYMLAEADRYGATLDFDFFSESKGGGRTDVMVIPVNAGDPDLAYAYIDALISPAVNASFATDLGFAPVNSLAVPELDPAAAYPFDYARLLFEDHRPGASCVETDPEAVPDLDEDIEPTLFEVWQPPAEGGNGKVSEDDWYAAWSQARAAQ